MARWSRLFVAAVTAALLAGCGGKVTSQRPASPPAVASAFSWPNWTDTFLPGSAQPQIVMGLSRWMTILLEKMPCVLSVPAVVSTAHNEMASKIDKERMDCSLRIMVFLSLGSDI